MYKNILCMVLITVISVSGWAECTKDEARQAETVAATLRSWADIYSSYKKFSHCDDGAIAEGYSESVTQMLANHWNQIGDLRNQISKDEKFEKFILKHLDETISTDNSVKISKNVKNYCPKGSKALCKKIQASMK